MAAFEANMKVYLTADQLRQRFNAGRYWERTLSNEFMLTRRSNKLVPADSNIPVGTHSQTWMYSTRKGKIKIAIVHQYLRPDGKLGGSGRPDPKYLFENGVEYHLDETQNKIGDGAGAGPAPACQDSE